MFLGNKCWWRIKPHFMTILYQSMNTMYIHNNDLFWLEILYHTYACIYLTINHVGDGREYHSLIHTQNIQNAMSTRY